jgi:glucosamine--fructose-6-phosphate aminotransferase (isomerizing)
VCGIVGYIGDKDVDSVILVGLEKLEYRGYDSAGIATISDNELSVRKRVGKLRNLADVLNKEPLGGKIGIGHTRWATHGEPNEINAHPQLDCGRQFAVVHNGIVENCYSLKEQLLEEGHVFQSDTDTEVVAHLIEKHYRDSLEKAVLRTVGELKGSFALAVISERDPQKIVGVRRNSPLVIGVGKGENLIASDIPALLSLTRKVVDLEDGEICVVEKNRVSIFTFKGRKVSREPRLVDWTVELTEKKGYPHFMLKEIYEQPEVLENNLRRRVKTGNEIDILGDLNLSDSELSRVSRIFIQACGTSWHAGLIAKYLFEH